MKTCNLFLMLFCIIVMNSCDNTRSDPQDVQEQLIPYNTQFFEELVVKDNLNYSRAPEYMSYSFIDYGVINTNIRENEESKDSGYFLELDFLSSEKKGERAHLVFTMELVDLVSVPDVLERGMVVFLNNQLIIIDHNSGFSYNFFVKTNQESVNRTPLLTTEECMSIKLETFELSKRRGCSCMCPDCGGPSMLNPPCSAISCGCTSICGGGCTVTCNTGHTAACVDLCAVE